ncbi:MAG: TRAP transporter small permease [Proteobacteria bacterium]|nr:TRAP transporter small permease [Pseudomonadota bacterium]MBU1688975.1 TRAP transporter small permease [Pseudomonadota bacterium]
MNSQLLKKALSFLNQLEDIGLSFLLLTLILLACLQIMLRIFFSTGIAWADPFLRYLVLWSGMLGAVKATRLGKHVSIDLVSHFIPQGLTRWLMVVGHIFSMIVCIVLTIAATRFIMDEATYGSNRLILGLRSWQLNSIFPVAFALMGLRYLTSALTGFWQAIHPIPPEPASAPEGTL